MNRRRRLGQLSLTVGTLLVLSFGTILGQDPEIQDRIVKNHVRFIPSGPGPFPTPITIPGCSGVAFSDPTEEANHPALREDDRLFRGHYLRAAERLRREGFAVLLIHIHAAGGLVTACGGEIPAERLADYIDESVAIAEGLDFVDRSRIHVIGWSMGGGGVLSWLRGPRTRTAAVRSTVAVYPDCSEKDPLRSPVPLLMLLGGADDIAIPSECEELVASSGTSDMITLRNYPGARHGYDIEHAPPVLEIGSGMTIGYQRAAADATWKEILALLEEGE